jgi:hypothetical protein
MQSVTKFNVYRSGALVASYDSQAPATTFAKHASRRSVESLEVIEEEYAHVRSTPVRYCVEGKIYSCS